MKLKYYNHLNIFTIIGITLFIIITLTTILFIKINQYILPKVTDLIIFNSEKIISNAVPQILDNNTFNNQELLDILKITKNSQDEIISVDYDMSLASKLTKESTNYLSEIALNNSQKYFSNEFIKNDNEIITLIPLNYATNYPYLVNIGPKIPIKISLLTNYYSTFESKVTDLGINTILIELYLKITITNGLLINFSESSSTKEYTILIASKVINGRIPKYYGGVITSTSPLVTD